MDDAQVINLTTHPVTFVDTVDWERQVTVQPARAPRVRVQAEFQDVDKVTIDGLTVTIHTVKDRIVKNLPPPRPGVLYVVSGLVAAHANRDDVVSPIGHVRDPQTGKTIGATGLLINV